MSINATLLGQMITFALFVWFTMAFVWPPLMNALSERRTKIADGLAAAERGEREWQAAQEKVKDALEEARTHAHQIIQEAHNRAGVIEQEAKEKASEEHSRTLKRAEEDAEQLKQQALVAARKEVASIALLGVEKVLHKQVDQSAHQAILKDLVEEL